MASAAPAKKPYRKAPPQHRELRYEPPTLTDEQDEVAVAPEQCQEAWTDLEQVQLLQHQNDELRQRLAYTVNKVESLERELDSGRHFLEMELSRNREELEKFKDKFRRLQNSYTASQRTNQDLEEKLHTIIKKTEMDKKTLDWEIVELTNKLLDAKTTIDKLEELNERYRRDCNLAVQLLKCNKSHFRNHKFADLPYELQELVSKHLQGSVDQSSSEQDPATGLASSHIVPTSVIAKVLEKPESLILNSAKSSSSSGPVPEDVFVHVDMSSGATDATVPPESKGEDSSIGEGEERPKHHNRNLKQQKSLDSVPDEPPTFEKLNPYPPPPPPHTMYPGRKVIEFSDDKVRIPKNSPLPNCTYATRQAISLSLVQGEDEAGDRQHTLSGSPASSSCSPRPSPVHGSRSEPNSSHSSPPQGPSTFTSSASSEEDLLANWQRMFVDRAPPTSDGVLANRTSFSHETVQELQRCLSRSLQDLGTTITTYSDSEEFAQRDSSADLDSTELQLSKSHLPNEYEEDFSHDETQALLLTSEEEGGIKEYLGEGLMEKEKLLSSSICAQEETGFCEKPRGSRPHRSPKRMGVHHLHRKDSLTRAQEQGNVLL
uniref:Tight junction-associated protein 1 n=1 Tax=Geotrypetes seraphini TaxID=260995 RepID=A0A6P8QDU7_GEOSA|nr:tight junction-associated protein 1 [Geotrypetes seraphini]XP_033794684.1 tight junction-associated protein 1 [Geotrypetes seraphini]XP_033794685.1 tight junction-associated protein 1 [Geotrypetes seraphini]